MKSSTKAFLSYLILWISGFIMLAVEKEDEFARKNAAQSVVLFLGLTIINLILGWLPLIGWLISWIVSIVALVCWISLMFMAWQGNYLRIPIIADFGEKYVTKLFL